MSTEITRDHIRGTLGSVAYPNFLLYIMGPYKSFDLRDVLSEDEREDIDVDELPGPIRQLLTGRNDIDEAQAFLHRVQGSLRTDPGVNAFLAVDVDIGRDEVDAATQSIEYARHSNVTAFVLPYLGRKFGVGEEAGTVLEALSETHGDRMLFVHEADVTSSMLRAASERWDLRIESYETEAELVHRLKLLVADVMNRELYGDMDYLGNP